MMTETDRMCLELQYKCLKTFIGVFERTAPGVRYYINCTAEEDAECHLAVARDILHTLKYIKDIDEKAYDAAILFYRESIQAVMTEVKTHA